MAIDRQHRRLFVGCRNRTMVAMDADTGKVVATVPIGEGVDANRWDPGTQLVFSSNGAGTLSVIHEDSPDTYTVVTNVPTKRGARTMEIDPKTHRVYLVTAELGPQPQLLPTTLIPLRPRHQEHSHYWFMAARRAEIRPGKSVSEHARDHSDSGDFSLTCNRDMYGKRPPRYWTGNPGGA